MSRVGGFCLGTESRVWVARPLALGTGTVQRISKEAPAPREEIVNLEIAQSPSPNLEVFFHSDVGYERRSGSVPLAVATPKRCARLYP